MPTGRAVCVQIDKDVGTERPVENRVMNLCQMSVSLLKSTYQCFIASALSVVQQTAMLEAMCSHQVKLIVDPMPSLDSCFSP